MRVEQAFIQSLRENYISTAAVERGGWEPSAVGAKELSPAREPWVRVRNRPESLQGRDSPHAHSPVVPISRLFLSSRAGRGWKRGRQPAVKWSPPTLSSRAQPRDLRFSPLATIHYLQAGELPILTKGFSADFELVYPGGAPLSAVHFRVASEFGFTGCGKTRLVHVLYQGTTSVVPISCLSLSS